MIISGYNIRPFVVCVQEYPERTKFILKHFQEVGLDGVEVWDGFNGEVSGLETKWTYDLDNPGTNYHIGIKQVAGWISFYALWQALTLLENSHFLILEWDAQFNSDWRNRVEQALKDVPPDFDLLYVGSCCCKGKPMKRIKGDVYQMSDPQCGHATIIAKKALPVMLATQRKIYAPLDISLAFHTLNLLKVFVILPRVADQFDTFIPE